MMTCPKCRSGMAAADHADEFGRSETVWHCLNLACGLVVDEDEDMAVEPAATDADINEWLDAAALVDLCEGVRR